MEALLDHLENQGYINVSLFDLPAFDEQVYPSEVSSPDATFAATTVDESRGLSCRACGINIFGNRSLQICHFRSTLHVTNLRRRLKGLPPIEAVEDHDDLVPVFDSQSEVLTELYGEFFLAEMIQAQDEENKALVAEVGDKSVGLMSLSSEMDVVVLQQCFDLGADGAEPRPESWPAPGLARAREACGCSLGRAAGLRAGTRAAGARSQAQSRLQALLTGHWCPERIEANGHPLLAVVAGTRGGWP